MRRFALILFLAGFAVSAPAFAEETCRATGAPGPCPRDEAQIARELKAEQTAREASPENEALSPGLVQCDRASIQCRENCQDAACLSGCATAYVNCAAASP